MSTIFWIVSLLGFAWFWLDSSRARELAVAICKQASENYQVQLLDDSVVLKQLSLRWPAQGLRLYRVYSFDFSRDGVERLSGSLALTGINLDYLDFDFSMIEAQAETSSSARQSSIVPIRRPDRH